MKVEFFNDFHCDLKILGGSIGLPAACSSEREKPRPVTSRTAKVRSHKAIR